MGPRLLGAAAQKSAGTGNRLEFQPAAADGTVREVVPDQHCSTRSAGRRAFGFDHHQTDCRSTTGHSVIALSQSGRTAHASCSAAGLRLLRMIVMRTRSGVAGASNAG